MFWILIERTNSERSCKIRYSGKDLHIFLIYWGVPLWCLPASRGNDGVLWQTTIYSDLVNWGIRLNDLISWKLRLFRIYFLHQNTWILGRIDLFLCLVKWQRKKKRTSVRITPLSITGQPMSTILSLVKKKEYLFYRTLSSGYFTDH